MIIKKKTSPYREGFLSGGSDGGHFGVAIRSGGLGPSPASISRASGRFEDGAATDGAARVRAHLVRTRSRPGELHLLLAEAARRPDAVVRPRSPFQRQI